MTFFKKKVSLFILFLTLSSLSCSPVYIAGGGVLSLIAMKQLWHRNHNSHYTTGDFYRAPNFRFKKIAVLGFVPYNPSLPVSGEAATNMMILMLSYNHYEVVERNLIKTVMKEKELKMSGITTEEAIKIGKLLNADVVLVGAVLFYGTEKYFGSVGLTARIVDVSSGKILWVGSAWKKAEGLETALRECTSALVRTMHR